MSSNWNLNFVNTPTDELVTCGRLDAAHLDEIHTGGVRTVINLCPPTELDWDEQAQVEARGMQYVNIPVAGPADLSAAKARELQAAVQAAEGKVLVHCQSSNRVGALFALGAYLDGADVETAVRVGQAHGLTKMEGAVRQILPQLARG